MDRIDVTREPDAWVLRAELTVPRPRAAVFPFFADPRNLEALMPPWLHFRIVRAPEATFSGALIDYRLRLHGVPFGWRTEIADWAPPERFVDQQLRGPYRRWHHTHRFDEVDGGRATRCTDEVRYRPLGGALVNALFVERQVRAIFAYRQARLRERFG